MPDTEDADPLARLPRRPIGAIPDYTVLSRQDVEHIARDVCERASAKFLTEAEIIRLIDQRSAGRWHNVGLTVSPDAAAPGDTERSLRKMFDWLATEHQTALTSKGWFFRSATIVAQIGGALVVIVGGLWAFFTFVLSHYK